MPYNSKFPILLTVDSPITKFVVQQCHVSVAYNGVRETLNCLRQQFWLPKAKIFIRTIIHECRICRHPQHIPLIPLDSTTPAHFLLKSFILSITKILCLSRGYHFSLVRQQEQFILTVLWTVLPPHVFVH